MSISSLPLTAVLTALFLTLSLGATLQIPAIPDPPKPPRLPIEPIKNWNAPSCGTKDKPISIHNGIIDPSSRWENFFVHPDPSFNETQIEMINDAIWDLQRAIPCLRMGIYHQNSTPDPTWDYVRIHPRGPYCSSEAGRSGGGPQDVTLADHCWEHGTIVHELMHALGVHHEHMRPDRDDYVNIIWDNIIDWLQPQFEKFLPNETSGWNVSYDFHSIMHYRATEASHNGLETIVAKNGEELGPIGILTDSDILKLSRMYGCEE